MTYAPIRFFNAVVWPVSIWTSLTHLEEHPADDYVGRTSPIVAFAVAFWLGVAAWFSIAIANSSGQLFIVDYGETEHVLRVTRPGLQSLADVILLFLPLIYIIGFWMFTARDERYPR